MKKAKLIPIVLSCFLVLSFSACTTDNEPTSSTNNSGDSSIGSEVEVSSDSPDSSSSTEEVKNQEGEGDIGDCHIKIVSAEKGQDISGQDLLIVTFEWTNNSDDEKMFTSTFSVSAYQNGVECSSITVVDGVETEKMLAKIKPGVSLEVQESYILSDTSDVTVEVGPWIDLGNSEKITKVFSVAE